MKMAIIYVGNRMVYVLPMQMFLRAWCKFDNIWYFYQSLKSDNHLAIPFYLNHLLKSYVILF